ncbi:MAG: hypothetical protein U1E40_17330 [Amaricoccus sp.]
MKTVNMKDEVFELAERSAGELGVSVDEFVSDLVAQATRRPGGPETPKAYRARMEMVEMARKATGGLGGWKWNREELYAEREGVSRYQRPDLRGNGDE